MDIGELVKVPLRAIWKNESTNFTPWLEANIHLLAMKLNVELNDVVREQSVGPFSADLVATDDTGRKVIIENQLGKTDHKHLGQIITYVTNLKANCVIWIVAEPRQAHINAVNWLNSNTPIDFYLIVVEAVKIDHSKPAPMFHIISEPDEEIREASKIANELSERGRFNISFWTKINKKCSGTKLNLFNNRKPSKYQFHAVSIGKSGFSLVFLATGKYYGVELYIDNTRADENLDYFMQLKKQRSKIEDKFGYKLDFDKIAGKRACRIRFVIEENVDVMDIDEKECQKKLFDSMLNFSNILVPFVKQLNDPLSEAA